MAEAWERAVAAALKGQAEPPRVLTLDGALKCPDGHLPPPSLFEGKLAALEHLSVANIRLSSLEGFPHLPSLRRLVLSDNRIASGLAALVEAGLEALCDLDLSNNRIASIEDLSQLAKLRLESLDLYECPVTKIEGYRSKVFGMIPSLKYLDKVDTDGNERPETDEEEEEEEDVAEEENDNEDEVEDDGEEEEEEEEEEEGEEGEGGEEGEEEGEEEEKQEMEDHAIDHSSNRAAKRRHENGESENVSKDDQPEQQENNTVSKRKRVGDGQA
ncbi:acidic leucine-rich nuclear phosphoprotein 32-related protein-like [Curcuma longa]|uniref:acidic leucine-rich nuclear phosphoprotein 32-related protein-like n=1 Tax=Curcuma longa TaxID=136217 RepID=UPI003D9F1DC1